jgi:hypothetical protein
MKNKLFAFTLLATAFLFLAHDARSQEFSKIRIVRLSFVEGDVQFQRPGQDWQDARLNLPIEEGVSLRTANGYAEVEFEDALALHMGTNSTVEFTELSLKDGGRVTRLTIPDGTAMVTAKLRRGDAVSLAAGKMTVDLPHDARFRLDVSPTESWVSVFHGKVQVDPGAGNSALLSSGHALHVTANESASVEVASNPPQDDFDKWVLHREQAMNSAQSETSEVLGSSAYTEGFADLYNYGIWSTIPGFGAGWIPYGMAPGWMPFMYGQWMFMGNLGWDWVGNEAWGWLPYHFGYWVNAPGVGWAWLPPTGPHYWSPATASWVQVNNQLGWIPNAPPIRVRPSKAQLAAIPSTAVLASQESNGAIRAASQLSLTKAGMTVQPAGPPIFVASSMSPGQSLAKQSFSVSSAPASVHAAPPSLRAPSGTVSQLRVANLSSMPRSMVAPHSLPAPAIARGAVRGSYGSAVGMTSPGTVGMSSAASAPMSTSGPSTGAASRGGGSTGSSGGRR